MKKLFIVYLVDHISDISGGPRVIVEHANNLLNLGHNVEIWTNTAGDKPYFPSNARVYTKNAARLNEPDVLMMTDPCFLPEVSKHRSKNSTYLLLQHNLEWVSTVMQAETSAFLIRQYVDYFREGKAKILVVSTWLQQIVKQLYDLDSVVFPNCIEQKIFHPARPWMKSDNPQVLILYDPQVWKGFSVALDAVILAQKSMPNIKLLVLGRYFPEPPTKVPGKYYGAPFPVTFFNAPFQKDIASVYASADVFVAASASEGFGLSGLEAMACGAALLTTDQGGNRDYVKDGHNAIVVPSQNSEQLCKKLVEMLQAPTLRDKLVKNGYKTAKNFYWDKHAQTLEDIFRSGIISESSFNKKGE